MTAALTTIVLTLPAAQAATDSGAAVGQPAERALPLRAVNLAGVGLSAGDTRAAAPDCPPGSKRSGKGCIPRGAAHVRAGERCRSARKAVAFYRGLTWERQAERGGELADRTPVVRGKTCRWARYAAREWQARARAATVKLAAWKRLVARYGNPNVLLGLRMARPYGWHVGYEWEALYALWNHESGWSHTSRNPTSGACGIPQQYPCRLSSDPVQQIAWGLRYIRGRYGRPSAALASLRSRNWY